MQTEGTGASYTNPRRSVFEKGTTFRGVVRMNLGKATTFSRAVKMIREGREVRPRRQGELGRARRSVVPLRLVKPTAL
jgi:hypothetical protein